jgi:hypothetical protein
MEESGKEGYGIEKQLGDQVNVISSWNSSFQVCSVTSV